MSERAAVRGLMAIAAREVSERAALLGLAAVLAVVPFVAPRFGLDRPLLGLFLGAVMVFTAALLTGSSVIARDLAEGRLGFFLARPLPWWSIWGGKLLAALVLTFAAGVIVLGPSAFGGEWRLPAGSRWVTIVAPALLALIGIANAFAVAYRARSAWFALDLAMAAGLGWAVVHTSRTLMEWGAFWFEPSVLSAALWLLAAAVTIAGAAQVAEGRADIRRGHRVLSIVLWSLLTPAVLAYAAWGAWVSRFTPADYRSITAAWAAPDGAWIAVAGRTKWPRPESMMPTLLLDARTRRFVRVGPAFFLRVTTSADGKKAAWLEDSWSDTPRLMVVDLTASAPTAAEAPLPVPPGRVIAIALSPTGSDAAVLQGGQATLFTVGSRQPAIMAPVRISPLRQIVFTADGRAHMLAGPPDWLLPGALDLLVLDPVTKRATVTGHIASRGNPAERWGPGGDRVAVIDRQHHAPSATLHDGTTGALLATLVREGAAGRVDATFLRDGRLAVVECGSRVVLRVFTRDGTETLALEMSPTYAPADVAETVPGVVGVELPFQDPTTRASDTVLVDVSAGRILRRERGLRPASTGLFVYGAPVNAAPAGLFVDERGALVRLDMGTGARQVVLGGG